MRRSVLAARLSAAACALGLAYFPAPDRAVAQEGKPNIVVIWGDDIGYWNISAYNHGMMGYKTPNIDRLARKARCSPTITASKVAPPAAPPSSPAKARSAPAC